MGRALRFDPAGGWHHVMNRGVNHERIYFSAGDGRRFLELVGDGVGRDHVEVHAFCLMPNHFHLLLRCPDAGLPEFMHRIGSRYARYLNDRLGRDGPIFRGRYRSLAIISDTYLRNAARYIHRNPADIRPVVGLDDYRWSSYRNYCGLAASPPWLLTNEVLGTEGGIDHHRVAVEWDEQAPGADALAWAIETAIAETDVAGSQAPALRRAVALLLAETVGVTAGASLSDWLSFPSESARRSALSRARARVARDPNFAMLLRRAASLAACQLVPGTS